MDKVKPFQRQVLVYLVYERAFRGYKVRQASGCDNAFYPAALVLDPFYYALRQGRVSVVEPRLHGGGGGSADDLLGTGQLDLRKLRRPGEESFGGKIEAKNINGGTVFVIKIPAEQEP